MTRPSRRRQNPKHLQVLPVPAGTGISLATTASQTRYVGSSAHKDLPSFAGSAPTARPDASICPRELALQREQLETWLRQAIERGNVGGIWENGFPRYAWHRQGAVIFEARHIGRGEYKGYPLKPDEIVRGLHE